MDSAFTIGSILVIAAILGLIGLGALLLPRLNDDSSAWVFACGGSTGLVLVAALALAGIALMSVGDEWGR